MIFWNKKKSSFFNHQYSGFCKNVTIINIFSASRYFFKIWNICCQKKCQKLRPVWTLEAYYCCFYAVCTRGNFFREKWAAPEKNWSNDQQQQLKNPWHGMGSSTLLLLLPSVCSRQFLPWKKSHALILPLFRKRVQFAKSNPQKKVFSTFGNKRQKKMPFMDLAMRMLTVVIFL